MPEFNESGEATGSRGGRLLKAAGIVAALTVAGVISLIVLPQREEKGDGERKVRSASPNQVSAPGREVREPDGLLESGQRLPTFALPDLSGRMTPSSELLGKPLVLNVWASWCPPCIKEMPSLIALHAAAQDDFTVASISVDEDLTAARGLAERFELPFPVLLDPSGDLPAKFGTVMFPETWIFDAEGRLIERVVGERDWSDAAMIRRLRAGEPTGWGE